MYSQSNLSRLSEISTLSGEPFLAFMDALWEGRLNDELSNALGGNDAFFRIFRFPRDRENLFPVLVLRVTSVVDRNRPLRRPAFAPEEGVPDSDDESEDNVVFGDDNDDDELTSLAPSPRRTEMASHRDHRPAFESSDSEDDWMANDSTPVSESPGLNRGLSSGAGGYAGGFRNTEDVLRREHTRRAHLEELANSQRRREERNNEHRARARAQAHAHPQDGEESPDTERAGRSWVTYVVRGSFPENHPIFTAESLRTNHPSREDLQLLDQLFMPSKNHTATQEDVDRAGGVFEIEYASPLLDERCPVCLVDYDVEDECRKLGCSHVFHRECVDSWLIKSHNSCPMCRHEGVPLA